MKGKMFGSRIKEVRNALGLSQLEFASQLGITNAHISAVEAGKGKMSLVLIKMINLIFGVNEEWLLEGCGDMFVEEKANFVRCAKCDDCHWSEDCGLYLCGSVVGMNGALDPKNDGCTHGRR